MRRHTSSRRRFVLTLGSLSAALLFAGCAGAGSGPGGLVLYNGQHAQTTAALVRAFERQSGIKVSVRSDAEDILVDQIAAEEGRSPADVIYTENSPALQYLQDKHLLAFVGAALSQVPRRYSSPARDWLGVTARVSVLVYNTRRLAPRDLPKTVLALASPRWRGKLAIAPSETDFQPVVTAVADAYGTKRALSWLEALARNGVQYADNESVTAAVNSGQAELGVIDQYYWYRLRAELGAGRTHSAIAFFAPGNPGYVLDVSGAAVLASSRHKRQARAFLSFLVGQKAQEIIARSDSFEYPLVPGVRPGHHLPPLGSLRPDPIGLARLGDGARAIALMRRASLLP